MKPVDDTVYSGVYNSVSSAYRKLVNHYHSYNAVSARSKVEEAVIEYKTAEEAKLPERHAKFRALVTIAAECREISTSATDLQAGVISFISPRTKIANPAAQRKIPSLRTVGKKFDPTTLPKKSIETSPEILAEDDVALRARLTGEYCRDIIDRAIREGREFTRAERFEIAKFHNSLQVLSGNLPHPGLNQRYAMPELLTYMQERATEIVTTQLQGHLGNPLKAPTDAKAYAQALTALSLNPGSTLKQIQEALISIGPDNSKAILTGLGVPVAAQPQLLNALRSQKNLDEDVRKANVNIEQLNKFREGKEASPQHEAARKALEELKSIETWNRLLKDFTREDKRAGLSSVAALEATRAVLSSPTDIKTDDLKEKISKPVTAAELKDAKPITASANAAQTGAERAINTTKTFFQGHREARHAADISVQASKVANSILGMSTKDFKSERFILFEGFNNPAEDKEVAHTYPAIITLLIASTGKENPKIEALIGEGSIPVAQKRFSLAIAVSSAVYMAYNDRGFCDDLAKQYLDNGSLEEKSLTDLINHHGLTPEEGLRVRTAIHTAHAITEGIAASNQAVASAKNDTEKAGAKFPPAVAKAIAVSLQAHFEDKQPVDEKIIKQTIAQETNRANLIIKQIAEIELNGIEAKPEDPELPKKVKDAVINKYLATGRLDGLTVKEAINSVLPNGETKPTKTQIIQLFVNSEQKVLTSVDLIVEQKIPADFQSVKISSDATDTFTKDVIGIYENIPGKVAHDAAKAIAKVTGIPEQEAKAVAEAAQREINARKTPEQAAEAAIKLLGPQHEAAFVPLAAVLSRKVGLPIGNASTAPQGMAQELNRPLIQRVYAQGRSRTTNSTATAAIGAAVAETMSTTLPAVDSGPVVDAIVKAYLQHGFKSTEIRQAIDSIALGITAPQRDEIVSEVYKAMLISVGMQAVQAMPKDATKNTRAIAGTVAVAASNLGASQENALKWSKALAEYYTKQPGDLNKELKEVTEKVTELCPEVKEIKDVSRREGIIQSMIDATQAASGTPAKADATAAGTAAAAKLYPKFDDPRAATAVAAVVTEAHHGDSSAVSNAAAYTQKLGSQVLTDYAHISNNAVVGAAATTTIPPLNPQLCGDEITQPAIATLGLPAVLATTIQDAVRRSFMLALANLDPTDANYNNNLKKVTVAAVQVSATATQQGLTPAEVKAATVAATNVNIWDRDKEDLVSGISVALASTKAQGYWETIHGIGNILWAPQIPFTQSNLGKVLVREAQREKTAPGALNTAWNAKIVNELAQRAYHQQYRATEQAANTTLGDHIHRSSLVKAYAEIAGKQAIINAYYTAMVGKPALSPADYHEVSVRAMQASQEMRACVEKLKQDLAEAVPGQAPAIQAIPIPVAEPESTARKLASSSVTTSLIQTGIAAGTADVGNDAAKALAAITAIATEEKMDQKEQVQFLEDAKKILESPAQAAKAGALIATLTKSLSPEAARAMAAVVAHFKAAPPERAQAIRDATTATSVMIDERASLPSAPDGAEKRYSLDQYNKDEFTKRQQRADELLAAMDTAEKSKCPPIEDSAGLHKAYTEAHLDDANKLNAANVDEWTITTTSGRGGHSQKTQRIKDIPGLVEFAKRMKACDPHVTRQTIERAIDKWNKTPWLAKIEKRSGNPFTSKPQKGDYPITEAAEGGYDIDLTGLSNPEVEQFLNVLADQAEEDKRIAEKSKAQDKTTPAEKTTTDKPGTLHFPSMNP